MAERSLTIKIVGDAKDMRRAARDVKSSLDETESAGKALARAIDTMSADMQRNFRDAADTTRVLEEALGQDTVAALQSVGRNVDDMVREWKQAGLTYDEIRADADEVARALRDSVEAGRGLGTIGSAAGDAEAKVKQLGDTAGTTRTHITEVRDSADQSGSVLANMVGNSVQDLGALGGVAGTAGMALGQLAEYATEGNINMAGLAKVAGPMVAVGAAVAGAAWFVGKLGENSEKARRASEGMLAVQEQLRDGRFAEAASSLQKEWGGTISVLEEMGFTTEEVIGHLTGQADITAELDRKIRAKRATMNDDLVAQEKYDQSIKKLRENLGLATTAFGEQGEELELQTRQTDAVETALRNLNGTAEETGRIVDLSLINKFGRLIDRTGEVQTSMETAVDDGVDPMQQALDDLGVQFDKLMDKFDDREAVDKMNEALADLMVTMADQESDWTDLRQKSDDYARSLADVVMSMEDLPTEVKSQFLAWIDAGQLDLVRGQLDAVAKTRTAEFQILVEAVASAELKQMENRLGKDINGNGVIGRAAGGAVWPGGAFAVGDNPDGSWNSTTELFVPNSAGRILSAGDARGALGGTTNIYITQQIPPTVDKGAIGRETVEAILEYQREAGPVFLTTRS